MKKLLDKIVLTIAGIVLILLVLTVSWQVVSRYILNSPSTFTDEFSRFSLIWVGLLSASYAFGQNAHLSIRLLEIKLNKKTYKKLSVFIYTLAMIFMVMIMVIGGGRLAIRTITEISPALGWSMGMVYLIIPISGILNTLYLFFNLKESLSKEELRRVI